MQIDLKEAARLFNISEREMLRWVESRGVPAQRVQDQFMFNRSELAEWAHHQGLAMERSIAELAAEEKLPTAGEALLAGGIVRLPKASAPDKDAAIRSLVNAMPLPPKTDRSGLARVIIAREKVASTGIGEGIAIPHVRNPLILNTEQPLISLCLLEEAIEFGAIDRRPVHALFTMISPNARVHLHLISRLALLLQDSKLKGLLETRAPDSGIMNSINSLEAALAAKRK